MTTTMAALTPVDRSSRDDWAEVLTTSGDERTPPEDDVHGDGRTTANGSLNPTRRAGDRTGQNCTPVDWPLLHENESRRC
jgi:hypothetical protein